MCWVHKVNSQSTVSNSKPLNTGTIYTNTGNRKPPTMETLNTERPTTGFILSSGVAGWLWKREEGEAWLLHSTHQVAENLIPNWNLDCGQEGEGTDLRQHVCHHPRTPGCGRRDRGKKRLSSWQDYRLFLAKVQPRGCSLELHSLKHEPTHAAQAPDFTTCLYCSENSPSFSLVSSSLLFLPTDLAGPGEVEAKS